VQINIFNNWIGLYGIPLSKYTFLITTITILPLFVFSPVDCFTESGVRTLKSVPLLSIGLYEISVPQNWNIGGTAKHNFRRFAPKLSLQTLLQVYATVLHWRSDCSSNTTSYRRRPCVSACSCQSSVIAVARINISINLMSLFPSHWMLFVACSN